MFTAPSPVAYNLESFFMNKLCKLFEEIEVINELSRTGTGVVLGDVVVPSPRFPC